MAFSDYLDLRTAVIELVKNPDITDVFDRLTKLAESKLNRELRFRQQITSTSIVVSGGTGSLPTDFLEMIGVYDTNGREFVAQPIQAVQPSHYGFFSIDGTTLIANDRTYTVHYYAALPTITDSMTDTNWLLSAYPEIYLYAVAAEAARHMRNAEEHAIFADFRDGAILEARGHDNSSRYSRGRVRVQGVTP